MALESEPQSTPLGGSNLDALKSESSNNVDLEDGEIDDDDDDNAVLAVSSAPAPASAPAPTPAATPPSGPPTPRVPPTPKNHDPGPGRRDHHDNASLPPWMQRRLGPTPPKNKKNKGSWGPPHKNSFVQDDNDDDFAKDLEKALQAKAREKAKQANKEMPLDEGMSIEEGDCEEDNNDHPVKKKKKRKKNRDDEGDGERERDSKRRRREGDEDDMIFVRGASPHRDRSGSPPFRDFDHDRHHDSFGEDDEDFEGSPDRGGLGGFSIRGRGRGNKSMRGAGRGRGRMSAQMDSGRGGFMNKRGGKRGKGQQRPGRERNQEQICQYYMQGKCPKEADECQFSHDAMPRRKMELCKFYNMNCCAKREKCLYMHKDFPCKFFHTGRKCNSGEKCRFSHEPLTDGTRNVLLKHIELAPKEILGEFRRPTREQAIQIIDRAAKLRAEGKNPEGIDLLRFHEEDHNESGDERAHTPMPSSPGEVVYSEPEVRKSRGEDNRRRDYNNDRDRNRDRNNSERKDHSDKRERRDRKRKRRWDSPDDVSSQLMKLQETLQRQLQQQDDDEKSGENKIKTKQTTGNISAQDDHSVKDTKPSGDVSKDEKFNNEDFKVQSSQDSDARGDSESIEKHDDAEISGEEDSQDASTSIPTHLPKRQRELFLRIQQQQREADQAKESKSDDSDDDAAAAEDDWYSSDEDGPRSLTDVLKNLKDGQKDSTNDSQKLRAQREPSSSSIASHKTMNEQSKDHDAKPARRPPLLPTPTILTDFVKNNSTIDQLLSTIRYGPTGAVLSNPVASSQSENPNTSIGLQSPPSMPAVAPVPVRDPRLSRDPRNRRGSSATSTSPSASPSSNAQEMRSDPRREIRSDPRSERRDPRTESRQDSLDSLGSPRASGEQRDYRPADPRAARPEGSSSSVSHHQQSIYDSAPVFSGSGDIDLRIRNAASENVGDTDFRRQNSQFGAGDMDLRRDLSTTTLSTHDTDLRFRLGLASREQDSDYGTASQSDMDLRRMQMMLPFKPAPVHTPATEIDASLGSYTPAPYHVVKIDIPKPDCSHLKINAKDRQVKLDPRLRRLFGLSQSDTVEDRSPLSPPPELVPQRTVSPPPVFPRSDPRRRNSGASAARPADPRNSRMGAEMGMGIGMGFGRNMGMSQGPMCPPTPRAEDFDEPSMADIDLRMQSQFGRQQAPWENPGNRGRGLLPHPDSNWMPNAPSSYGRASNIQTHSYHQQRSYTPPPT